MLKLVYLSFTTMLMATPPVTWALSHESLIQKFAPQTCLLTSVVEACSQDSIFPNVSRFVLSWQKPTSIVYIFLYFSLYSDVCVYTYICSIYAYIKYVYRCIYTYYIYISGNYIVLFCDISLLPVWILVCLFWFGFLALPFNRKQDITLCFNWYIVREIESYFTGLLSIIFPFMNYPFMVILWFLLILLPSFRIILM